MTAPLEAYIGAAAQLVARELVERRKRGETGDQIGSTRHDDYLIVVATGKVGRELEKVLKQQSE